MILVFPPPSGSAPTSLTDAARKKICRERKGSLCSRATISSRNAAISHCTTARFLVWCCSAWANPIPRPCALLSGIDTGVSNFCKGCMYHHGYGVAQNTEQAIRYYQLAALKGFKNPSLQPSLRACYQADAKEKKNRLPPIRRETATNAQRPTTRLTTVAALSLTATCRALHAGDDCRELNLLRGSGTTSCNPRHRVKLHRPGNITAWGRCW